MFASSLAFHESRFDNSLGRGKYEQSLNDSAANVDYRELNLRDARELFTDRQEQIAYDNLNERFKDEVLYGHSSEHFYNLDVKEVLAFGELLADAKVGTQRNAAELGVELATALTANDKTLGGKLRDSLERLKAELKAWDALLASAARPNKNALREQARKCADRLDHSFQLHGRAVTDGEIGNPFLKYQLLATMRALSEKVASQYAARAGKASFVAMCELVRDVPNRGLKGEERAKELKLSDNPGNAWPQALGQLEKELRRIDGPTADEMNRRLPEISYGVVKALDDWRANYKDLKKLKNNLESMRDQVATIAFALNKYKTIADAVLGNSGPKFNAIGDRYQQTFDAFASQLQSDVQLCLNTFGS